MLARRGSRRRRICGGASTLANQPQARTADDARLGRMNEIKKRADPLGALDELVKKIPSNLLKQVPNVRGGDISLRFLSVGARTRCPDEPHSTKDETALKRHLFNFGQSEKISDELAAMDSAISLAIENMILHLSRSGFRKRQPYSGLQTDWAYPPWRHSRPAQRATR